MRIRLSDSLGGEQIQNLLNGTVGLVIGGFDRAGGFEGLFGPVMEQRIGEGAADVRLDWRTMAGCRADVPNSRHNLGIEQDSPTSLAEASPSPTKDVAPNLALPWVLRLRYGMVTAEAAIILCMAYLLHVNFPVFWTLAPLFAILASNIALARSYRASAPFPEKTLGAIFTLDTLCLTIILGLTGGAGRDPAKRPSRPPDP